jgi:hypothetical protein
MSIVNPAQVLCAFQTLGQKAVGRREFTLTRRNACQLRQCVDVQTRVLHSQGLFKLRPRSIQVTLVVGDVP